MQVGDTQMLAATNSGSKRGLPRGRLHREVLDADAAKLAVVLLLIAAHRTPVERTMPDYVQVGSRWFHGKMSGEPNELKLSDRHRRGQA